MSAKITIRLHRMLAALPGVAVEAAQTDEVKKLAASDAQDSDEFGTSVAVSGDTAIVGALWGPRQTRGRTRRAGPLPSQGPRPSRHRPRLS